MREWAELYRDMPPPADVATDPDGGGTFAGVAVAAMFKEAARGNVAAFRALMELMGEPNANSTMPIVSPLVLGIIPPEMVEAAKSERQARRLEA